LGFAFKGRGVKIPRCPATVMGLKASQKSHCVG
jgi:hypothetical protein